MMSCARSRMAALSKAAWSPRFVARASYTTTAPRLREANDPNPPKRVPNVSATDATPVDAVSFEGTLQEDPEVGERIRSLQAPNRANTWAASQQPREQAMTGPRFEQTIMGLQVSLFFAFASSTQVYAAVFFCTLDRSQLSIGCIHMLTSLLSSPNPTLPLSSSTDSLSAGRRSMSSDATAAVVPWAIPKSTSTPTSPRLRPVVTAVCPLYVPSLSSMLASSQDRFLTSILYRPRRSTAHTSSLSLPPVTLLSPWATLRR